MEEKKQELYSKYLRALAKINSLKDYESSTQFIGSSASDEFDAEDIEADLDEVAEEINDAEAERDEILTEAKILGFSFKEPSIEEVDAVQEAMEDEEFGDEGDEEEMLEKK